VGTLIVHTGRWHQRAGTALLAAAEPWGRAEGAQVACLNTYAHGPVLVPSYEQHMATPDADLKGSSARSIAWSDRVVRGGVEPPTFRFSGVADIQVGACHRSVDGCRCTSMVGVGCRRCRQRCRRLGQVIREVVVPIITLQSMTFVLRCCTAYARPVATALVRFQSGPRNDRTIGHGRSVLGGAAVPSRPLAL
jgi:hypothetical protein